MFANEITLFREIVDLALKREAAYNRESKQGKHSFTINEMADKFINNLLDEAAGEYSNESSMYRNELKTAFNALDFELIKTLQVIMYLGRDEDYDTDMTPEKIYESQRDYFDQRGWNTKDIEIRQMMEKMPLGTYLENGFKILNITF